MPNVKRASHVDDDLIAMPELVLRLQPVSPLDLDDKTDSPFEGTVRFIIKMNG